MTVEVNNITVTMSDFRANVMAEIVKINDSNKKQWDTDHIIVSERVWHEDLPGSVREKDWQYLGMNVWKSSVLDKRDKDALLMTDEVFNTIFLEAKDF